MFFFHFFLLQKTCGAGTASVNANSACTTCPKGWSQEKPQATSYHCNQCGKGRTNYTIAAIIFAWYTDGLIVVLDYTVITIVFITTFTTGLVFLVLILSYIANRTSRFSSLYRVLLQPPHCTNVTSPSVGSFTPQVAQGSVLCVTDLVNPNGRIISFVSEGGATIRLPPRQIQWLRPIQCEI